MKTRLNWLGDVAWRGETDSGHDIVIDGAPKIGGKNRGPRPMELVVQGLCSCAAMDVLTILRKQRQEWTDARIEARAERADAVPAVFTQINVHFLFVSTTLDPQRVEKAVKLSMEKYCSVSRMLAPSVKISYSSEVVLDDQ